MLPLSFSAFDPPATLAVHCDNGFDAGVSPYQSTPLSRYDAVSRAWEWIRDGASSLQPLVVLLVYYAGRFQAHRRRWVSTSQRNRLAIAMICACALGGCAKSKEDAQIELIECAAFMSVPQSLSETIYKELRNIGIQPVAIMPIPTLANAYTVKFDRTVVSARWNKGVTAGKESVEKRDVAGIAKYLKSCVGTMNDALRD